MVDAAGPDIKWIAAFAGLWIGLTIVSEIGAPQFAATLAVTIALSTLVLEGPKALAEVDRIVG